jgi:uncharacterized protein YjiK
MTGLSMKAGSRFRLMKIARPGSIAAWLGSCVIAAAVITATLVRARPESTAAASDKPGPVVNREMDSGDTFKFAAQGKLSDLSVPAFKPDDADTNYSGVAYNPATKTLFVVDNEPNDGDTPSAPDQGDLYEYETDGTYRRRIRLVGFSDPEGIAYLGVDPRRADCDRFVVCEERIGRLAIVSVERGKSDSRIDRADATIIEPTPNPIDDKNDQPNDGFEGVAYDPKADVFYLLKENGSTRGVYRVGLDGKCEPLKIDGLFAGVKEMSEPIGDLADVQFHDGCLFVLSEITNRIAVIRMDDLKGTIIGQIPPIGETLGHKQPEGLALAADGEFLWIIGEPREFQLWRRAAEPRAAE